MVVLILVFLVVPAVVLAGGWYSLFSTPNGGLPILVMAVAVAGHLLFLYLAAIVRFDGVGGQPAPSCTSPCTHHVQLSLLFLFLPELVLAVGLLLQWAFRGGRTQRIVSRALPMGTAAAMVVVWIVTILDGALLDALART